MKRPPADAAAPIKTNKILIVFFHFFSKSCFGVVLVKFWIQIRIQHEKLHLVIGSDEFFIDLEKSFFLEIQYWLKFLTFEWYFEGQEHENRTQHEKICPGSYS